LDPVHSEISGGDDVFLYGFVVEDIAVYANFLAVDGFVAVDVPLILQGVVHHASEDILGVAVDMTLGSDNEEASDGFLGLNENVIFFAVDQQVPGVCAGHDSFQLLNFWNDGVVKVFLLLGICSNSRLPIGNALPIPLYLWERIILLIDNWWRNICLNNF